MLVNYTIFFQYVVGLIIGGWICFGYLFPMIGRWIVKWTDKHYHKNHSLYSERWIQKEDWEEE